MYCDFFLIRWVSRGKMNDNLFTEALFDLGGVRLSLNCLNFKSFCFGSRIENKPMSVSVFVTVFAPFFLAVTLLTHLWVVCRHFSCLMWTFMTMLIVGIFFIGCSSSDIQYKFVIQHTHTQKKKRKKRRSKKQKTKGGRCNGTNVPCEAPLLPRGTAPILA